MGFSGLPGFSGLSVLLAPVLLRWCVGDTTMDLTPASSVGAPAGSPGSAQRQACEAASWQLSSESSHGPASFPQVPLP